MKPHQNRVVNEKNELDNKREKLTTFLNGDVFQTLDVAEQSRLKNQLNIMSAYSEILGDRIAAFSDEAGK